MAWTWASTLAFKTEFAPFPDLWRLPDASSLRARLGQRVRLRPPEALHRVHGRHPLSGPGRNRVPASVSLPGLLGLRSEIRGLVRQDRGVARARFSLEELLP